MAENVLETRIQLRYGTYSQWMNSDVILMQGEAAICAFPNNRSITGSNITPENTPPAIGIKIGDGQSYFYELPWVQAVAADVFNWAKSSTKPSYTASEIQGLKTFIEESLSGDEEFSIAPRLYQLVRGTEDNINKYYLQYKESTEDSWTVDTNSYIDLTDLARIVAWIKEENLQNYPNLTTVTGLQTLNFIRGLSHTEEPVANMFVTSVSESDGVISTTKAQPNFSNITGTATVAQGGTGATSFNPNEVLIGAGENAIQTRPIATEIAANTDLVPNYLVKSYVDSAVEGLTGAMHFVGEASVVIAPNTNVNPQINGYNFANAQPGDVILSDAKEFVWTGGSWRLLGDEGSYAVKGSITDADIAPDAAISVTKIAGIQAYLSNKVDKVEGKGLSTNDYTNEEKEKLASVGAGAQRNTIEHIFLNDNEIAPTTINSLDKSIDLQIKEFDQESQNKLSGIESGAQVNTIEHIYYDGIELTPTNKSISITSDPHTEHENKIETISINGVTYYPNTDKQINLIIDQAALNLNVLEGATIPTNGSAREEVTQSQKKLLLERIAVTGNVEDLKQTTDTYITLDCGSSTDVI